MIKILIDVLEEEVRLKEDEKYCPKCGFVMSRELDFYSDPRTKDGLNRFCKDCVAGYQDPHFDNGKAVRRGDCDSPIYTPCRAGSGQEFVASTHGCTTNWHM